MPKNSQPAFTFIDLFAGIGGFHAVAAALGGECVYAVENNPPAARIYEQNWGHNPLGDITNDANDVQVKVPPHDVLFAGFPCQPFSKSGEQKGMEETRGTLYWNILRIIERHKPTLVVLENVRNLAGPRHTHEWQVIVETLQAEGYRVAETPCVFSPHLLPPELGGRPQVRERVYITATLKPEGIEVGDSFTEVYPQPPVANKPVKGWNPQNWRLEEHLPLDPDHHVDGCDLSPQETVWVEAWNEFVEVMWEQREGVRLPGFPIWADEWVTLDELDIPDGTPAWKATYLRKNAEFYTDHKRILDAWTAKWGIYTDAFPASRRKFEWQAQDTPRLWDCVMHFRPSGIRAKAPTYVPALVAITQTSVVGSRRRRLSPREAARLQGLPDWFTFEGQPDAQTYKQLGNGVSVGAVWHVVREHVRRDEDLLKHTPAGRRLVEAVLDAPETPDPVLKAMRR